MSLATTLLLIQAVMMPLIDYAAALRCYCTDDHCVPYGICEANVCLVGLLKSSNAGLLLRTLLQHCYLHGQS